MKIKQNYYGYMGIHTIPSYPPLVVPDDILEAGRKIEHWMRQQDAGEKWELNGICSRSFAYENKSKSAEIWELRGELDHKDNALRADANRLARAGEELLRTADYMGESNKSIMAMQSALDKHAAMKGTP